MGRRTTAIGAGALLILGWSGACRESTGPDDPTGSLVVSDPTQGVVAAAQAAASVQVSVLETDVAYISLPLESYPTGVSAAVRNTRTGIQVTAEMTDGGLDPVAIAAEADDEIEIEIRDAFGTSLDVRVERVPTRRRPRVVRTAPPRGKTDVPVNGAIVVVFSEPVNAAALTNSSLQLYRGSTPVPGTVQVLQGTGTMVAFVPSAPLATNAGHRLVVTQSVTDLDGDALEAGVATTFVTGGSSVGEPASVVITTDTIEMRGGTYQLTASVYDFDGNQLVGIPLTWSTSDPGSLQVSETGLLTALAEGEYDAFARAGEIAGNVRVHVDFDDPATTVTVTPGSITLGALDTVSLAAIVRDAEGRALRDPVTWSISDPAAVQTEESWDGVYRLRVIGVREATVTVTATSGSLSGTSELRIGPPVPAASITLAPTEAELVIRGTVRLTAALLDATGRAIRRSIEWRTEDASVATVDASGVVTAVANGSTEVVATSGDVVARVPVAVRTIALRSVESGYHHSCGFDDEGLVLCWGTMYGAFGPQGAPLLWSSSSPARAAGDHRFVSLAAGTGFTCGLRESGAAYCWGANDYGQLGDGTTVASRLEPAPVTGGHTFTSLDAGDGHACGITTAGDAYCWGLNTRGQLGNGSDGPFAWSEVPVAARGGIAFAAISAGGTHTCALTTAGAAYCWGSNSYGELGIGSTADFASTPLPVTGGHRFTAIDAGRGRFMNDQSCAITTGGDAWCWGANTWGQLGTGMDEGAFVLARTPVPVAGGHTFTAIGTDASHACALDVDGRAYCWGFGLDGRLGDGGPLVGRNSSAPVAVTGGLVFSSLSVGGESACGVTTDFVVYCWGANHNGELGDGSTTSSSVPVKVAGQP